MTNHVFPNDPERLKYEKMCGLIIPGGKGNELKVSILRICY